MINSFLKIVKSILSKLDKNDYPVLNTRLFVSCWLGFVLDKSLTSMRDLCWRLNFPTKRMDISTFSKASKQRSQQPLLEIYEELNEQVKRKNSQDEIYLVPIDGTIITLTSKLLLGQGYADVKLISGLDLETEGTTENIVTFGKKHDSNFGPELVESLPPNAVAVRICFFRVYAQNEARKKVFYCAN